MLHWPSHARLWIIAGIGLTADLWTKDWAFRTYSADESKVVIKNLCSLQLSLNPGALFGLGAGMAPVFVGASVLALMFVLYLFANAGSRRWSMHLALGLVLGGALGNLYDRTMEQAYAVYFTNGYRIIGDLVGEPDGPIIRIRRPNAKRIEGFAAASVDRARSGPQPVVRDFVKIEARIGSFELWPWIFNVADALLVFGVGILLINFWMDHRQHRDDRLAAEIASATTATPNVAMAPGNALHEES